jgi:hypothetical protein
VSERAIRANWVLISRQKKFISLNEILGKLDWSTRDYTEKQFITLSLVHLNTNLEVPRFFDPSTFLNINRSLSPSVMK